MPQAIKVWVYLFNYNYEHLLPLVLEHYSEYCDKIIVYDNGSTDGSLEAIKRCPKAEVVQFITPDYDDYENQRLANECWKPARGQADWVIVADLDELIYCDNIKQKLARLQIGGFTAVKAVGYNMITETFPPQGKKITDTVQLGVKCPAYHKTVLFRPDKIDEINFSIGGHYSKPTRLYDLQRGA